MVEKLFWLSFFALHWLILLDIVERDFTALGSELLFFIGACLITLGKSSLKDLLQERRKE